MKLLLSTALLLIVFSKVIAQVTFHKSYSNAVATYTANVECATSTIDSGVLILGQHFNTSSSGRLFILKTDKHGNRQWSKSYDGLFTNAVPLKVIETHDHGFAITGFFNDNTVSLPNGNNDAFILKIDDTGAVKFARKYGGISSGEGGYSIVERPDKTLTVAGHTSQGVGPAIYVINTDSVGNVRWTKTYSHSTQLLFGGYRTEIISDGAGYFIATVAPTGNIPSDLCLMRIDTVGNFQWAKSFGGVYTETLRSFNRCSDGGFLLGGYGYSFTSNHGVSSGILVKTDSLGNVFWTKHFPYPEVSAILSVQETKDHSILIGAGGETNSLIKGMRLLKMDDGGNLLWAKNYGNSTTGGGMLYGTEALDAKAYYVVGQTNPLSLGDYYLVRTDSVGNSGCLTYAITPFIKDTIPLTYNIVFSTFGTLDTSFPITVNVTSIGADTTICYNVVNSIQEPTTSDLKVYPNPSSGIFSLSSVLAIQHIQITSVTGAVVFESHPYALEVHIDLNDKSSGIYFYNVQVGESKVRGKLILK